MFDRYYLVYFKFIIKCWICNKDLFELYVLVLKTPIEDSTATSSTESSVSSAIPPRNDSAPTVDEVYNIYDSILHEPFMLQWYFKDLLKNIIEDG